MPFKKARELTEGGDDDDEQVEINKLKCIFNDSNVL